jgi:lysophospholipase L1-like esterase
LKRAATGGTNRTVVLLGDSITEGWARPFFSPFRYSDPEYEHGPIPSGGQLAEDIVPFAIGGDRIQDLGYRLFQLGGMDALRTLAPKSIILTIGTNDFGQEEDVNVAVKEMEILVKQLQSALPSDTRIVLQAPLPRGRMPCRQQGCNNTKSVWDVSNPAYIFHKQLSDTLARSAHENSSFLDCSDVFLHQGKRLNAETFSSDVLHLSKMGYRAWASCIERHTGIRVLKTQ